MEERSQRAPTWVWIVLVIAVVISLGCGLVFGGISGYLLGSKGSCEMMDEHEYMPRFIDPVEPDAPRPPFQRRPDLMPRMPDLGFGAWVTEVVPGTPAEEAGIQVGDVILEVDGKSLDDRYDLPTAIRSYRPGDRVTITVWRPAEMMRGEGSIVLRVVLGTHPDERGVAYLGVTFSAGMPHMDIE